MEYEELCSLIFNQLKPKLENNQGLSVFARERAKFEGWLKVELCDSLLECFQDVVPEKNRIDITFDNWAIELKTVNTNIRYTNVKNKGRPITKNTQGVIEDIDKLKSMKFKNKSVLVVVFPIQHDNSDWQIQLKRISNKLSMMKRIEFDFKDKIQGVLYFGLI